VPKYDFKCETCGIIEIEKSMRDDNPTECPDCGGSITRVFLPTRSVLKGGGFYSTDNRPDDPLSGPDRYDRAVIDKEFD
jgi:putative FmdB family regulatory protein